MMAKVKEFKKEQKSKWPEIEKGMIFIVDNKPFIVDLFVFCDKEGEYKVYLERRNSNGSVRISDKTRKSFYLEDFKNSCKPFDRDKLAYLIEHWNRSPEISGDLTVDKAEEIKCEHERIKSSVLALCPHDFNARFLFGSDDYCHICYCDKE